MDLANLLSHTVYTPKDSSHYKRSAPLSPPVEEPKCSLPSISALLEGADGAQHSAKRQRLSPHRDDIRHYEMPPTPPLRPGSGNGQSRASPVNTKESHHRSSVSSTSSIHINAQPYASPAPSVSSYTSPVEAPQHQHHQQPMYYTRPPTASTFAPATPVTVPAPMPTVQTQHHHAHGHSNSQSSSALISPVTPAWQHHHYFPPPPQHLSNRTTTGISAAHATRPSPVLPPSAFTATRIPARSLSGVRMPAVARPSPCGVT
ncbi:hypothetical protein N7499_001262 [Penicillium canescens]|nr:hypothetical protein N7444_009990 [Penicillium canescens]KAJ6101632.1 hypothetical protein N7499_001262 [Penicillium canescens]